MARSATGYVYVLTHPSFRGLIKIGYTTQPIERRIAQLSTGSPVPFRLAYAVKIPNLRNVEQALHTKYAAHKVKTPGRRSAGSEWFALDESLIRQDLESHVRYLQTRIARTNMNKEWKNWLKERSTIFDWAVYLLAFISPFLVIEIAITMAEGVYNGMSLLLIFPLICLSIPFSDYVWEKAITMGKSKEALGERERLARTYGASWKDPMLQPGDIRSDDEGRGRA